MKAINDISGEHALDLHHNLSHRRGIDIDMFHISPFNINMSGEENYEILRDKVLVGLAGDATARADVTAWVTASRTGLDPFLNLADVRVVIYAVGTRWTQAGITLPDGWAETLIRSGTLTVGTLTLETGAGAWTNTRLSKFSCDKIHNSHVHIGLDETKLIT